jgi:hypothetical protein
MKNIHIIQTDKPSTLIKDLWKNTFFLVGDFATNHTDFKAQHIYITSDEEIKEGDWHYNLALNSVEKTTNFDNGLLQEKIILTTDQDLIKDGVQAIDDEFLEWFVKNPSCEEVEVENERVVLDDVNYNFDVVEYKYKIIIPKKEPRILTVEAFNKAKISYEEPKTKCYCGHTTYCDCGPEQHVDFINSNIDEFDKALKLSKQETLEESFSNTDIEPTIDENGNMHYDFKATMKQKQIMSFGEYLERSKKLLKQNEKETFEEKLAKIVSKEPSKFWAESDERARIREEKKQHLIDMMRNDEELGLYEESKQDEIMERFIVNAKQQETLEEAAERLAKHFNIDFIAGAKWQTERSYSEEEVLDILKQYALEEHLITSSKPDVWFEQFKKK